MVKKCSLFGKRVDNLAKTKISAIFDKIVGLSEGVSGEIMGDSLSEISLGSVT